MLQEIAWHLLSLMSKAEGLSSGLAPAHSESGPGMDRSAVALAFAPEIRQRTSDHLDRARSRSASLQARKRA